MLEVERTINICRSIECVETEDCTCHLMRLHFLMKPALIYAIFLERDLPFPAVAIRFSARLISSAPLFRNCCDGDVCVSSCASSGLPSCRSRGSLRTTDGTRREGVRCLTFCDFLMARWDIRFYWFGCSQPVYGRQNKERVLRRSLSS